MINRGRQRLTGGGARLLATRKLRSLTGIYACFFRPILASDADASATARSLGRHLGASVASSDIIQLDAIDGDWPELEAFQTGLKEAGFASARYDHFGNWIQQIVHHAGGSDESLTPEREPLHETTFGIGQAS